MSKDYYIIHKKLLPDYIDKVIYARELLETREVSTVMEAVKRAGISRNTYYKYKDYVFERDSDRLNRHAVISIILMDEKGALSSVLKVLSEMHTNILTISQAIPVANKANVLISLDISSLDGTIDTLLTALKDLPHTRSVHLDAIE